MQPEPNLSAAACERKAAMLPGLLGELRARRRRRVVLRTVAAGGALAAVLVLWSLLGRADGATDTTGGEPRGPFAGAGADAGGARTVSVCEVVHDRPDVLQRYAVSRAVPGEWFVDDDGLQQLLRDGARPSGLIRVGGRVLVGDGTLDAFPSSE